MEMTAAASWLMDAFSGFDLGILSLMHTLAEHAGVVLTPLFKLVTLLGEKGILFFLLALVLMCFARTRPLGVCIFGAVCCGALITNIVLKDWVARPRPFETLSGCYLMAHFPSDAAAAVLIGVLSGWIAYHITRAIFRFFFSRKKGDRLAWFVLNYDLPLPSFLRYKGKH